MPATSTLDCRNCGGPSMLRQSEPEDGSRAALACIRCGLERDAELPDLRHSLARAWGLVSSLRMKLERSGRNDRRHRGAARKTPA